MKYTWDPNKRASNLAKHGLDFVDAWEFFQGPHLVAFEEEEGYGEDRQVGLGFVKGCLVKLVFSERSAGTIRVISMRKATSHERRQFAGAFQN